MLGKIRNRCFVVLIATAAGLPAHFVYADDSTQPPVNTVLIADRVVSTAIVDAPDWDVPVEIRVVTLSDVPVLSPARSGSTATDPVRIATSIEHPTNGEVIHINIVEMGRRFAQTDQGPEIQWVINEELPFTRFSEVAAAMEGRSIRRLGNHASDVASDGAVFGWVSGEPIVEVFVWFDPNRARSAPANYGIQVVGVADDRDKTVDTGPRSGGGDPGGTPGPPGAQDGMEGNNDSDQPGGGDPGGSPGPPGRRNAGQ